MLIRERERCGEARKCDREKERMGGKVIQREMNKRKNGRGREVSGTERNDRGGRKERRENKEKERG